ncbi:MAG TPA: BamA/TamA family outer membrane protein [Coxiellaceae bacterium]|nr:BamA/TamA family outer membrane protein [Coxiellaceae bacterium]
MRYTLAFTALFCLLFVNSGLANATRFLALRYQVSGITDPVIQKNVTASIKNLYSKLKFPLTETEALHFIDKVPREIQNAMSPYGFFRVQTHSRLTKNGRDWGVQFTVIPGPPLPITAINTKIEGVGKTNPIFLTWKKTLPIHVGQPLQTEKYEKAKTDLYNLATRFGYFKAKMVKADIQINLTTYQATVTIIFDTGPRFKFGKTTFEKSPFHERFLRKFLTYQACDYYDATKLEDTQAGLLRGNYFDQVRIKPKMEAIKNGVVPITISLIPMKAKTYVFGVGYGTDTGPRGTAGVTLRHLGGDGHRFQTMLRASPKNSSLVSKYMIPGFNPANDLFTIAAGASNMNQSTGNANNAKFGLTYTTTRGHWEHSLTLAYLNERYNIVNLPQTSTELVYPTLNIGYINSDNPTHPKKGVSLDLQVTGADHNILSKTNFFQSTAHLKTLYTIHPTHTRLLFRSDLGHTSITNLINLPLSLQLFAGGATSVRGYGYNSIGPGRNLVVASTEIQQRIFGSFYLAGLVDAGVVGDNNIFQHVNVGVGPGIAWISPIGTIEFTVSQAITYPGQPWTYQFAMGTDL